MKKFLKLVPAFAMLLVAAILVSTSTYAWFSMNDTVKATNMQVKAVAERGLLINEVAAVNSNTWDESATAAQTGAELSYLYPASTANGADWFHGKSKKSSSAADATSGAKSGDLIGDYEALTSLTAITAQSEATAAGGSQAVYSTMGKTATDEAGYYVEYVYYLKGTTGAAVTLGETSGDMNVYIKEVKATLPGTQASENLNKSLRVGVQMSQETTHDFYIFAPVTGYDSSYFVATSATTVSDTATTPIAGNVETTTDLGSLPGVGTVGAPVHVFIWYEGEDVNCKSDNATATALDNISIEITFELKAVPTTP